MKISSLYDNGSEIIIEDRQILSLPFLGVADGASETYWPGKPQKKYGGLSGGQRVVNIFGEAVFRARKSDNPLRLMKKTNDAIRKFTRLEALDIHDSSNTPIACFALLKINGRDAEIIQAGDTMAIWETVGGKFGYTPNQVYTHDMEMLSQIKRLAQKYDGDRKKIWAEFGPAILEPGRRLRVNRSAPGGYGVLNGQRHAPKFWFKTRVKNFKNILLATDGFFIYENTTSKAYLSKVLKMARAGGLKLALNAARGYEVKVRDRRHTDYEEAAAIFITA